jgi:hypothetical protein
MAENARYKFPVPEWHTDTFDAKGRGFELENYRIGGRTSQILI